MAASFYGNLVGLPENKGMSHIAVTDPASILVVSVTTYENSENI